MEQHQLGKLWPVSALTLGGGGLGMVWGETTFEECVATVHAASPESALLRLDRLAQRANVPPQRYLVAEAIHWIAVLEGSHARRRLTDLVRVEGLDRDGHFVLHRLTATAATPSGDSV